MGRLRSSTFALAVSLALVAGDRPLLADEPSTGVPTRDELLTLPKGDPDATLRRTCDWLMTHQRANGFFPGRSLEWYQASYPVRVLLAGYEIYRRPGYLRAAERLLDRFVSEQLPNGAWAPSAELVPTARRTRSQVQASMEGTTNTADAGCIATCLSVASRYVDRRRSIAYLAAHRRFADQYAIRFQLPSGAFTNGRWLGRDMTTPYSVATGTQGMSFCALHAATGEVRYLQVAERAVRFLLDHWLPDGRPTYFDYRSELSFPDRVTAFGNNFYYHEAILWVWHWTEDVELKDRIREVYGWHITGEEGLLVSRENGVWWPITSSAWENSKAPGMPLVLIVYDRRMRFDTEVHDAVELCTAFLSSATLAGRLGFLGNPLLPGGEYAGVATGFAGLSLAELVEPGVIYLRPGSSDPAGSRSGPRRR